MKNSEWNYLVDAWDNRALSQFLKPGTKTYLNARLEFFVGAHAMLCAQGDTNGVGPWLVLISIGRPLEKLTAEPEPRSPRNPKDDEAFEGEDQDAP